MAATKVILHLQEELHEVKLAAEKAGHWVDNVQITDDVAKAIKTTGINAKGNGAANGANGATNGANGDANGASSAHK